MPERWPALPALNWLSFAGVHVNGINDLKGWMPAKHWNGREDRANG
jgi:hypothetical protein